jgi:hypothetical protein
MCKINEQQVLPKKLFLWTTLVAAGIKGFFASAHGTMIPRDQGLTIT